jgi:hypothetical protein
MAFLSDVHSSQPLTGTFRLSKHERPEQLRKLIGYSQAGNSLGYFDNGKDPAVALDPSQKLTSPIDWARDGSTGGGGGGGGAAAVVPPNPNHQARDDVPIAKKARTA